MVSLLNKPIGFDNMIEGVILAAGNSTRIGFPKPLLKVGKYSFIETIILKLINASINNIIVILGDNYSFVQPIINKYQVKIIKNEKVEEGQISSIKIALENISKYSHGFISFPVDFPFVKVETLKALIDAFLITEKSIVLPKCNKRRGHPVIFKKIMFPYFFYCPLEEGARWILKNFNSEIYEVNVEDVGVLYNINSLVDYKNAISLFNIQGGII